MKSEFGVLLFFLLVLVSIVVFITFLPIILDNWETIGKFLEGIKTIEDNAWHSVLSFINSWKTSLAP